VDLETNFLNILSRESGQIIVNLKDLGKEEELEAMKWVMVYIQGSEFIAKLEGVTTGIQTERN
jgi:hypothetical protein